MTIDINKINAALADVSLVFPQLTAAYAAYKAIWTIANAGKTEADFFQHLDDVSKRNVSAADALLLADGFVQDSKGNWSKPAPTVL